MKKFLVSFALLAMVMLLNSCGGSKKIVYFQNIDNINLDDSEKLHSAKIMPKDMLSITVSTIDPAASAPFNMNVTSASSSVRSTASTNGQEYLVDNEGYIEFPVVGKLQVVGLTSAQCQEFIKGKIAPYLAASEKPIVVVRISDFKVTILGEVNSPRVITMSTERPNIMEAIAQAGDLTLYGKRDNVMLIREDASGKKSVHRLDLRDACLIESPYYYLQQNDIIYIQPNAARASTNQYSPATALWVGLASSVLSLASLIVNLVR
jgi:polysaccharide export outer membrane protein